MLKEWDATTFALKREIDLGGKGLLKHRTPVPRDRERSLHAIVVTWSRRNNAVILLRPTRLNIFAEVDLLRS